MEFFLERIARSLKDEYGNTLNRHCLVFPGRRAGLYFLKHLAANIDKPVWAPPVYTINDLFRSYSSVQPAGNEILLFELFRVYRKIKKSGESFDDFYFWGDMLLNDFDEVDKYLVDASLLFRNLSDLKNIDQEFGALTEAHVEIIKRFWINFEADKPTDQKNGFINLWSVLLPVYDEFRKALREKNLAFEGMIFRDVAELQESEFIASTSWDMVHFIGFNAINECEKKIMLRLKKSGKARFYWDYDNSYIGRGTYNSAGHFMRENLKMFGNNMPADWSYDTLLSSPSINRKVIETSSDIAQVKLVPKLISEIPGLTSETAHQTAVVLADENLLIPLLTSLPDVHEINITMGYPLRQSMVYTLLRHIMDLQKTAITADGVTRFDQVLVGNIFRNPLLMPIIPESEKALTDTLLSAGSTIPAIKFEGSAFLSNIFRKVADPAAFSAYVKNLLSIIALDPGDPDEGNNDSITQRNILNEFIYRIVLSLNRLDAIINDPEISFTTDTFIKLFDRMLRSHSIPFSGEPLTGIQMMGILETRVLDFKNLIILSVNEGVLPAISSSSSFIPFSLRGAFGLPSVNHQESIFAYHFYRLLQKAENVIFTYNSNSEGLRNGEMSRFLIQMKYDSLLKPDFRNLDFMIKPDFTINELIEKNETHIIKLNSLYLNGSGRALSPSAINTWLACRMKFYYRYINGLREPEKSSSEIDPAIFGKILHDIMKNLYEEFAGNLVTSEQLERLIGDIGKLRKIIDASVVEQTGNDGIVRGNEVIIRDVLLSFTRRILRADKSIAPLRILHLEKPFSFDLEVSPGLKVKTGGIADRIDNVLGTTRIVDYKTGIISDSVCRISDLFEDDRKKDHDGWLQALIYCEAYLSGNQSSPIRPSIYGIKKMSGKSYDDHLRLKPERTESKVEDYTLIRDEFLDGLREALAKIFSKDEHFTMTKDARSKCRYCSYNKLCLR